jgi:phosphoglycolate phosphatase-like HAD superfamily hydrolase
VHDIRNFTFDFEKYLERLDGDHRKALVKAIEKHLDPATSAGITRQLGLRAATLSVMAELHVHRAQCRTRDLKAEVLGLKAALFDKQKQSTPKEE